jgi:hypothetical protein
MAHDGENNMSQLNTIKTSQKLYAAAQRLRLPFIAATLCISLGICLTGCAGEDSALKKASTFVGFATNASPQTPEFITQTRPQKTDFVSVGNPNPPRALSPKTPAEIEQAKAALDQTRTTNEGLGAEAKTLGSIPPAEAPVLLRP